MSEQLREKLAELAHEQWVGWMRYMFDKGVFNDDGTWTMPDWAVERWLRQCATPYADLSEDEQNSDRAEADKFLAVFEARVQELETILNDMQEAHNSRIEGQFMRITDLEAVLRTLVEALTEQAGLLGYEADLYIDAELLVGVREALAQARAALPQEFSTSI